MRAVGRDLDLFCADVHSLCRCSVYESVGEVLKFIIAAAYEFDVVEKSYFEYSEYRPSTSGDGCVLVMECFLHDLLKDQVEHDG